MFLSRQEEEGDVQRSGLLASWMLDDINVNDASKVQHLNGNNDQAADLLFVFNINPSTLSQLCLYPGR